MDPEISEEAVYKYIKHTQNQDFEPWKYLSQAFAGTNLRESFRESFANGVLTFVEPSYFNNFSPPARWGLLDFMSVASSSSFSSSSASFCLVLLLLLPRPPLVLLSSSSSVLLVVLVVLVVLAQLRPAIHSVLCRTSTTTIHAQCSLPDLNHDHPRPVFPAGPQPRPSTPSIPCRTSITTILAQCSLPDLNHDHPRPVFPAGPQPRVSTPSVPCRTSCRKIWDKECAEEK